MTKSTQYRAMANANQIRLLNWVNLRLAHH